MMSGDSMEDSSHIGFFPWNRICTVFLQGPEIVNLMMSLYVVDSCLIWPRSLMDSKIFLTRLCTSASSKG